MTGPSWRQVAGTIREVTAAERAWQGKVTQPEADRLRYTRWMPFQPFRYLTMVAEAAPDVLQDGDEPPEFLEIGAGIGTKMMITRDLFGANVHGIERYDEYAAAARARGLDVVTADALEWPSYANYHLVWFNRVYHDTALQAALEAKVWAGSSPGTVVMCANLEDQPPGHWWPILDSWADERIGIWQRPFTQAGS